MKQGWYVALIALIAAPAAAQTPARRSNSQPRMARSPDFAKREGPPVRAVRQSGKLFRWRPAARVPSTTARLGAQGVEESSLPRPSRPARC